MDRLKSKDGKYYFDQTKGHLVALTEHDLLMLDVALPTALQGCTNVNMAGHIAAMHAQIQDMLKRY